jgi:hypothetical protein
MRRLGPILGGVSTRPLHLSPELAEAVARARQALDDAGELHGRPSGYQSPLDAKERAAVARIIADGTYRRLADAVAADDPEIGDQ